VLLGVVEAVLLADGIAMLVSIAAGAGAIAGAEVSAVAASSFLDVHAARAKTAATRARRFIYDLLGRQTWNYSPVRARGRSARCGAGESLSHPESVSRVRAPSSPLARGLD